ncbi:MAG TPA: DUF2520 domain-containing protein [Microbacteriaceae bacterium]|nr:DUF2520 domain-containing protein [Microbacteriaceae bacterium]
MDGLVSAGRAGRLGVGVIGAGHVGPVLGAALAGAGHALVGVAAVSAESRDRAGALLPGVPLLDVPVLVERSELVVVAVPDDELAGLVAGLAGVGAWQAGQLVLHTSARHGIGVLAPARERGAIPLAVHPALTFTGTSIDVGRLSGSYFAVTAPAPVLPIAQALVVEMGGEPVVIDEADRAAYAEAIEVATAFPRRVIARSAGLLSGIGVPNPGGFLASLVQSTVDEALRAFVVTDEPLPSPEQLFGAGAPGPGPAPSWPAEGSPRGRKPPQRRSET